MLESVVHPANIAEMIALAITAPQGCFVEVGVYRGGTAQYLNAIAHVQDRELYAYDTFDGIPFSENDDHHKVGDFSDTNFEQVRAALEGAYVVRGVFPDSAVPMPAVAFANIDCDQYRSICETINHLTPLMAPGGVMYFDDAGVDFIPAATRAVEESFPPNRIQRTALGKYFVRF